MIPGSVQAALKRAASAARSSKAAGRPNRAAGAGRSGAWGFANGDRERDGAGPEPVPGRALTRKKKTGSANSIDVQTNMAGSGPVMKRPPKKKRLFPGQACHLGTNPPPATSGSGSSSEKVGESSPRSRRPTRSALRAKERSGNAGSISRGARTVPPLLAVRPCGGLRVDPSAPRPSTTGGGKSRWSSVTEWLESSSPRSSLGGPNK
mmetsp:Transcript_50256/g.101075  ORF Transcript_50256/g.101075 Transcript_50256/m.101075 type:complete len:207 (+) Transcript_50256:721-1341(+)